MKIQTMFDLMGSAQDLLSFFEGVETPSQVISRLENLKRGDVAGMLDDLNGLRIAVTAALSDTIELGGSLSSVEENPDELNDALDGFSDLDLSTTDEPQDAPGKDRPAVNNEGKEKTTSS